MWQPISHPVRPGDAETAANKSNRPTGLRYTSSCEHVGSNSEGELLSPVVPRESVGDTGASELWVGGFAKEEGVANAQCQCQTPHL